MRRRPTIVEFIGWGLAGFTLVTVLRAELLEQRHGLQEWRNPLNGTIRHIDRGLTLSADGLHVGTLGHEVLDQRIVAASRGVMHGVVAVEIPRVDVEVQLLD